MKDFPKTILVTLISSLLFSTNSFCYESEDDEIGLISLEDLLNIKVTVASGSKGMTVRESPGIVTLITNQEITNSGARDLIDVLNLVPGFTFGVDVQGVVGISARGNWSHEGKISLMVDDMEMNELSFATLQFGNHFPVDNIERIELIRGPGSAIYGGFAEMGVIKIITKNAETLKSTEGSVLLGRMNDGGSRVSGSLAMGKKFDDSAFSANLFYTQGQRSDRDFSDFYDTTYNMDGKSDLDSMMLNLSYQFKGLSLRYLHDKYEVQQADTFFVSIPEDQDAIDEYFQSDFFDIKYDIKIGDNLTLTPQINLKKQKPWNSTSQAVLDLEAFDPDSYEGQFFDDDLQRLTYKFIGSYDFSEDNNLIFGVSNFEDEDKTINIKYDSTAIFAQSVLKTDVGTITTGARWEDNSEVGSTFLPRLGYTNVWDKSHLKVLWSKAFRAPVIQNILDFNDTTSGATSIKPENTTVFEIETGYQVSKNLMVTLNVYDILIEDPIVYYFDDADSYRNYEEVGTRGFEFEARYNDSWGYLNMNFSNYEVSDNKVDQYATRNFDPSIDSEFLNEDQLHGTPSEKFTVSGSFNISDDWKLNSSIIFEGTKYAYVAANDDDDLIAGKLDSVTLVNVNAIGKNLIAQNIDLQFGVFNLLNEDVNYVQPYYDGYHAALPGPSRELFARLSFSF